MKITKLSLTNFKSFKQTQHINFAPVTLLFGPNSVGKSSVLMALFYLQQILAKGQCNPQRLDALGDKFVGGFKNLIHGKDLNESITIGVTYERQSKLGSTYNMLKTMIDESEELLANSNVPIAEPAADSDKITVEFTISWSKSASSAYVSRYKLWLDGLFMAECSAEPKTQQAVVELFNYLHPAVLGERHIDWLKDAESFGHVHSFYQEHRYQFHQFDNDEMEFHDDAACSRLHELLSLGHAGNNLRDDYKAYDLPPMMHVPFALKSAAGAFPTLGQVVESSIDADDYFTTTVINEIISEALVSPLDDLLAILDSSRCIGPLRHIPDSTYQPNPYPKQGDWYDGRAAWDEFNSLELDKVVNLNEWLSGSARLDLGYEIAAKIKDGAKRVVRCDVSTLANEAPFSAVFLSNYFALNDAFEEKLVMSFSKEDIAKNPNASQAMLEVKGLERPIPFLGKGSNDIAKMSVSQNAEGVKFCLGSQLYLDGSTFKDTELTLWDNLQSIEVTPSDIGVGFSQLYPLVSASLLASKGLIACEQPELHVHPRVQVAIGDLLTQANDNVNFLIETHSEHLILRLLRRIRETSDGELPENLKPVTPKDVSIVYLEPTQVGVVAKPIDIDKDGEFTTNWPRGFFSERREELY
ncbi:DUF3696 domain-containing protein [Neiella marina]|uniref:DUF3696 domain-containing protein n=1 Tax=Neiella holothuriorum TaxID=2870530 RepID=A0ABS7EDH5_9GAMM|nr:DUF3696 domain-containing protein [Neiella holothuriorum]MBW8190295.1 DUF3696 domain-containing protein [Neiella holothuriorum]